MQNPYKSSHSGIGLNYLGVNYLATTPKDSGSPLIVEDPDNDRKLLVGIVYGSLDECNDLYYPSLFARLDDYEVLKFIRATAFGDNIPPKVKGNTHGPLFNKEFWS